MLIATDYDALLRGVLLDPRANLPRLVLADWLEENGQERRAKLIRRDIGGWLGGLSNSVLDAMLGFAAGPPLTFSPRRHLMGGLIGFGVSSFGCSRGFVCEVSMGTADFLANAAAVFSRHPVTTVGLTDRVPETRYEASPAPDGLVYIWDRASVEAYPGEAHYLPWPIFDELPCRRWYKSALTPAAPGVAFAARCHTIHEARADLSAACFAHGREVAGLPPLAERVRS